MNNKLTTAEREHIGRVKQLPCSVCNSPGPSDAHHIRQDLQYCVVALCYECHQGVNGWHGDKSLWRVYKMDELKALNITIKRLVNACDTSLS